MKITTSQKYSPGTDPLQDFEEDNPSQTIVIDYETDASSDMDDLSEVSMTSAGGISKQEFQRLLSDIGTISTNGSFHQCPSYQGQRYVGRTSGGGGSESHP